MNIIVPYSWIKEFLKTEADLETVIKAVNATGPTVERVTSQNGDQLLDIEVTINRPDCLSVLGVAREIFASLRQLEIKAELKNDYLTDWVDVSIPKNDIPLKFVIDPKLSPRFTAVLLKNIQIGSSPQFIKERLEKSGVRSLNNVIDITNYTMLELGQPNHAFDFDKITPPKFVVRPAKDGEIMVTLDGQNQKLAQGDNIIEDSSGRIIDLCGIMGGELSGIDNSTKNVLLIVVNDYFGQIRKTSMRLGIQTEASARLTKVLSPEPTYPTILREIQLMVQHAQAKVGSKIIDLYPKPIKKPTLIVSDELIKEKVGLAIKPKTTDRILKDLGFSVKRFRNRITAVPPIWRLLDVELPIDLIEEVARIYNYDRVPNAAPTFEIPVKDSQSQKIFKVENRIRQLLIGWGFSETLSYSMLSQNDLELLNFSLSSAVKIANPLTEEWKYMQPTLAINFLKNIRDNLPHQLCLRLFEIANVFDQKGTEQRHLIFGGNKISFIEIKGFLEKILSELDSSNTFLFNNNQNLIFETNSAQLESLKGENWGSLGQIRKFICTNFQIDEEIFSAEINLSKICDSPNIKPKKYMPIPTYPATTEDLAFIIPPRTYTGKMLHSIKSLHPLIQSVGLLDYYQNTRTFRVTYRSDKKTLTNQEVERIRQKIIQVVMNKFHAQLKQKN